jgi:hypothetical protein
MARPAPTSAQPQQPQGAGARHILQLAVCGMQCGCGGGRAGAEPNGGGPGKGGGGGGLAAVRKITCT